MRGAWITVIMGLVATLPGYAASGQLVLACRGETAARAPETKREDALLVFDFDRGLVFHDGAAEGHPIRYIKKFFITWKSEDGSREGYLNRLTLEAVELQGDGSVKTTYLCGLHAQLTFKPFTP
jgi:hypothetical protein